MLFLLICVTLTLTLPRSEGGCPLLNRQQSRYSSSLNFVPCLLKLSFSFNFLNLINFLFTAQLFIFFCRQQRKIWNMSISSILAMPLIPLASWIIHSQLELRGWSCLHGTSAFSMIHFLSYARGLLIVVYCSLADHMLFLCHRDYSRQRSECLGNEVH